MRRFLLSLFVGVCACIQAAVRVPSAELELARTDLIVTEGTDVTIHLYLPAYAPPNENVPPFSTRYKPTFSADFLSQDNVPLQFSYARETRGKQSFWHVQAKRALTFPKAGAFTLGPVVVQVPDPRSVNSFFSFFGEPTRAFTYRTGSVVVNVAKPPDEGRPASWSGAVAENFTVVATLDAGVCTAGDPVVLTVETKGARNADMILPPAFPELEKDAAFRLDRISMKTATKGDVRKFSWRVRTLKPGTREIPALAFGWYDIRNRTYREARTLPVPLQVKAGAQVVLGAETETPGDKFPSPDGIDLDVVESATGNADFTLKRALALATHAVTPTNFAVAARAYADYLESARGPQDTARAARHYVNLGALRFFAGDARGARAAFEKAERFSGATASTERGIRAALAKLQNDPRAELPLPRLMAPWFFRLNLTCRICAAVGILLGVVFVWWLIGKGIRRLVVVTLLVGAALESPARGLFDFNFGFGGGESVTPIAASASCVPAHVTAGAAVQMIVSLEVPNGLSVRDVRVSPGLPPCAVAGALVPYTNNAYRLTVSIPVPGAYTFAPVVQGVYSGRYSISRGNSHFQGMTSGSSFTVKAPPVQVNVRPLPEAGRPEDFRGAVGGKFRLVERLEPAAIRPGDLVTAVYRLDYEGYFPTNVLPNLVFDNPADFRLYPVRETARTLKSVEWRQSIVPLSTNAVRGAAWRLAFFNPAQGAYCTVEAVRPQFTYLSAEAASTQNTSVTVTGEAAGKTVKGTSRTLYFAPAESAPVLATIPADAPLTELSRHGAWRRVSTPTAIGWLKQ